MNAMVHLSAHECLSGVSGSISLAAWVFVLVPQLIENYKSGSADGISLAFLTVWFIGDLANFFGAVWARLVPTVIALAVYFVIADAVLITQCLYYKYVNSRKNLSEDRNQSQWDDPSQPLLSRRPSDIGLPGSRRRSSVSQKRRNSSLTALTLPTIPEERRKFRALIKNALSVFAICAAGAAGWAIAWRAGLWKPTSEGEDFDYTNRNVGAESLGYVSAVLYLGARIPQIVKNFRERSCEGLSLLFFILSLVGNLTYGGGILFHSVSKPYLLANLPWLIGSLGTMVEDVLIFIQFHIYEKNADKDQDAAIE